jgi:predicted nucleic acid-binding protein
VVKRACLDAGVITLYYQKDPPPEILDLFKNIKIKTTHAFVPSVILIEVYKHLCMAKGNDYATSSLRSFQFNLKPNLISLTSDLVFEAGRLKCSFRQKLSYIDCIIIGSALENDAVLHTTEKNMPKIDNLSVIEYDF